jgi:Zn-dependent M28 family amino/carboxypeptidase
MKGQMGGLAVAALLALLAMCGCGDNSIADRGSGDAKKPWEEFSGANALAHVQALVDLGPRPPASEAIEKSRAYIIAKLQEFGWTVAKQEFADETPRGKVSFVNLVARFSKSSTAKPAEFLLCSHYDTKTFDDARFVGANDGGSSTGALVEMARVLSLYPQLAARVELAFFDGEEAYDNFTETDGLYGSRYYAKQLAQQKRPGRMRGILWDMIGDRSLTITLPPDSPPELARGIFAAADALKVRSHFTYFDRDILDDHSPLSEAGVECIDLIDFDYPPWHTAEDTIDKLSAESLQTVGAVTAYYLSEIALK